MAGYSETFTKTTGQTIEAADFETEFTAITAAFDESTGHTHDGTADEGSYVPVLAEGDLNNAVTIDSTNNEIEFDIQVSGSPVEQLVIADGVIKPTTDNDIDLGDGTHEFKDLYIDGTANIDSLVADTADINGGTIDGVTIGASAAPTVTDLGTVTTCDINGGAIDGTIIGAATPAAGTFTTLALSLLTGDVVFDNFKIENETTTISDAASDLISDISSVTSSVGLFAVMDKANGTTHSTIFYAAGTTILEIKSGSNVLLGSGPTGGFLDISLSGGQLSISNNSGEAVDLTIIALIAV